MRDLLKNQLVFTMKPPPRKKENSFNPSWKTGKDIEILNSGCKHRVNLLIACCFDYIWLKN